MITLQKGSRFIGYILNVFFVVSCTTFSLHGMEGKNVRDLNGKMQQLTINDKLPNEILYIIFSSLSPVEWVECLQVCKRWREASGIFGKQLRFNPRFAAVVMLNALEANKKLLLSYEKVSKKNLTVKALRVIKSTEMPLEVKLLCLAALVAKGLNVNTTTNNNNSLLQEASGNKRIQAFLISARAYVSGSEAYLDKELASLLTVLKTVLQEDGNKEQFGPAIQNLFEAFMTNVALDQTDSDEGLIVKYIENVISIDMLEPMINADSNLNCLDETGITVQQLLYGRNVDALVESLHNEHGFSIAEESLNLLSPLSYAVCDGSLDTVKRLSGLIGKEATRDFVNRYGLNLLQLAVENNKNLGVIQWLIKKQGFDKNVVNRYGRNLLQLAVMNNKNVEVIAWLIDEQGFKTDVVSDGLNLLQRAVMNNKNIEVIKWLVDEQGFKADVVDEDGENLIYLASINLNAEEVVAYLKGKL